MSKKVLIITGDGGESYEALYAVHRFREAGYGPVVAAPARRRLHLVMHDFEPGWDTYIERTGYGLEADAAIGDLSAADYDAILLLGGRAPEYLRYDEKLLELVRAFDAAGKWVFAICHGIQVLVAAGLRRPGSPAAAQRFVQGNQVAQIGLTETDQGLPGAVQRPLGDQHAQVAVGSRLIASLRKTISVLQSIYQRSLGVELLGQLGPQAQSVADLAES